MPNRDIGIPVSEIFGPTIQGEGHLIGTPTVFVRTGGCDYRCSWCDTMYAVDPKYRKEWTPMQPKAICSRIDALTGGTPTLVTISGGNPCIHDLSGLLRALSKQGHKSSIETQGTFAPEWIRIADYLNVSPKPPSSGNVTDHETVKKFLIATLPQGASLGPVPRVELKIVIASDDDFAYASDMHNAFPGISMSVQPCTPWTDGSPEGEWDLLDQYRWLTEKVLTANLDVRVVPQLHALAWGAERGV